MYLSSVPFDQVGFDTKLGTHPIISYVKDFLAIVPMVLCIWPALFTGFYLLAHRKNARQQDDQTVKSKKEEGHE
jgi:formate dehydrogenase iron-sulfur subunit